MEEYPKPVTKKCIGKILDQMTKNYLYKIFISKEKFDIGFFCYIKLQNKKIPVIICNHIKKNNDSILLSINKGIKEIKIGKIIYINEELNISIMEIKEDPNYNINYLEIDDNIYEKDSEINYFKESIYIMHYNKENEISVSFGQIKDIKKSYLFYNGNINSGRYPIFNLSNNKLIGIHDNKSSYYNQGIFLKKIIKEFIKKYKYNQNPKNEIIIKVFVEKQDIKKKIYFLNGVKINPFFKTSHDNLKEINKDNSELYIRNKKFDFKKFFMTKLPGEFIIKLKFNINLTDCSYMFAECNNIIDINFISFNTKYVKNMDYMFFNCVKLKSINLFSFDTQNVVDMSHMFSLCKNLNCLDFSSFDINNVKNMSYMFYQCEKLDNLNLSSFNTKNIVNMNHMFYYCQNLINLDLSSFNINKENNINFAFYGCNKLEDLNLKFEERNEIHILIKVAKLDINQEIYFLDNTKNVYDSKNILHNHDNLKELNVFNTKVFINNEEYRYRKFFVPKKEGIYPIILKFDNISIKDCSYMFYSCENIIGIDLSYFDYKNITNMERMFYECTSLKNLRDISTSEINNITNMYGMFSYCSSLTSLPDISNWDTKNVTNMKNMFNECTSLKSLPDISKWDVRNVNTMENMFYNCRSLISLPNLYKWETYSLDHKDNMFYGCRLLKTKPDIVKKNSKYADNKFLKLLNYGY